MNNNPPRGGRPGRPPKPAPLRLLEGNPGKRKVTPEPAPPPGDCSPPADLSDGARERWDELAPELEASRLLAPRYVGTFAQYCEAYAGWKRCRDLVAAVGPLVERDGHLIANPACAQFARFLILSRALGTEFGLSPMATTAIGRASAADDTADGRAPSRLLG